MFDTKTILSKRTKANSFDLVNKARQTFDFIGEGFSDPDVIPLFDAQAAKDIPPYIRSFLDDYEGMDNYYTNIVGNDALLSALSHRAQASGLAFSDKENIVISAGAVNAFSALCYALCNEGDVILALAPTYILFAHAVNSFGADLQLVDAHWDSEAARYTVAPEALDAKLTRLKSQGKTVKGLFVVNPRNIDGDVWRSEDINGFADVIQKHELLVIEDRVYDGLQYDMSGGKAAFFGEHEALKHYVVTIDSVSKRYGATQWRVGWMFGPSEITDVARDYVMQSVWSPNEKYQLAAAKLLNAETERAEPDERNAHQAYFDDVLSEYILRRDLCLLIINGEQGYTDLSAKHELTPIKDLQKRFGKNIQDAGIDLKGIEGIQTLIIPKSTMFLAVHVTSDVMVGIKAEQSLANLIFARVLYQQTKICMLPPTELTLPIDDNMYRMEFGVEWDVLFKALARLQLFMCTWLSSDANQHQEMVEQALKGLDVQSEA